MDDRQSPQPPLSATRRCGRGVRLTEVNPHLVCVLCHGYFVDATTMAECPHSFCRSCIVLYLETKSYCPICEVQIHKTKPHLNLKPDKTLQDIVYKLVPGLYIDEMRRRRRFYDQYPNRDLYLGPEARGVGVERIVYSPDDLISLSLEYYDEKYELAAEPPPNSSNNLTVSNSDRSEREKEEWASARPGHSAEAVVQAQQKQPAADPTSDGLKRYLQCPSVVTMGHLKKFIRLKYGLAQEACTVEILYRRESLPDPYSLMDIAYIYTWKRNGPMRFYYRIHVPTTLKTALKASSEPIRDPTPPAQTKLRSPELLDAVGLRPKPPEMRKLDLDIGIEVVKKKNKTEVEEKHAKAEKSLVAKLLEKPVEVLVPSVEWKVEKKENERLKKDFKEEIPKVCKVEEERLKVVEEDVDRIKDERMKNVEQDHKIVKEERRNYIDGEFKAEEEIPKDTKEEKASLEIDLDKDDKVAANVLLSLRDGQSIKMVSVEGIIEQGKREAVANETKVKCKNVEIPTSSSAATPRPPTGNGSVFKVPQSLTKKFAFVGGKLVALKSKPPSPGKNGERSINGKVNGELLNDRFANPLGLQGNGITGGGQVGKLPPGSPRPPPNSEKSIKTKYSPPSGHLLNRLTPEISFSQNKPGETPARSNSPQTPPSQPKPNPVQAKTGRLVNGQPTHRKEIKSLERIVQNCLKKELSAGGAKKEAEIRSNEGAKDSATPAPNQGAGKDQSNLKRKLNDSPFGKESSQTESTNSLGDPKKRRMVTPDVSIELMANPAKEKKPSDLSQITKKFLHDIEKMKKVIDTELKISKVDQMCASSVKIEKVRAPVVSPSGDKSDGTEFSRENDQLFIDIRNKCESLKRKSDEPDVAIERVTEDVKVGVESAKTNGRAVESPPKPTGTHKKLPRLIEINAPPRPKLPTPDSKQKTGLKMTTVRKEVPIGREASPLVRKDSSGALDLSSGVSPPTASPKNGTKPNFPRLEKSPTTSPLTNFPLTEAKASPIRIPSVKPKISPTPRPSSLSSSSPSPPADARNVEAYTTAAYQQLFRQQMEMRSRLIASQVNNNWSRDPQASKKFEEWMRNMMSLQARGMMNPSQLSPETRK